ncbi:uncharacterized protein LOC144486569 [Mustelus asterias]
MSGKTYVIRVGCTNDFYVGRSENAAEVFAEVVQLLQPQPGSPNEMVFVYQEQLSDSEHEEAVKKLTGYNIERQTLQSFHQIIETDSHLLIKITLSGQRSEDSQVDEIASELMKLSLTKHAKQPSSEDGAVAEKQKVPDSLDLLHTISSSSQIVHTYVFQLVGTDYFCVGRSENPRAQLAEFEAVCGIKTSLACHARLSDSEHEETVQKVKSSNLQRQTLKKYRISQQRDLANVFPGIELVTHIYLIHEKDTTYYKVGFSQNPEKRLSQLQTGNPRQLIPVCHVAVSANEKEKEVQDELKDFKAKLDGGTEWFNLDTEDKVKKAENAVKRLAQNAGDFVKFTNETKAAARMGV